MKREDYTTLISYYIPNEIHYLLVFPLTDLFNYNSNMDITIDDKLLFYIMEPIIKNNIEYNYEIIEKEWDLINNKFSILLKVNSEKFNPQIVIENLKTNKMISGLRLFKKEYGNLMEVYCYEK